MVRSWLKLLGCMALGLSACATPVPAHAATDVKISAMPSATPLTGTELVPVVQGGANKAATATQFKTFVNTGLPLFDSTNSGAVAASGGGTTNFLRADGTWTVPAGGGSGTVSTVSVVTANGVSGSVATNTTTPAITLSLGAITPTSVAASGTVTGSNLSGSNTGDQFTSVATATILGRTTAGTGAASALTGTQATTLLDAFTTSLKGLAPASGGGTANFLRADGTWAVPPGTGGGGGAAVTSQSGTTYTAVIGDANTYVRFTNASAVTFTIPTNASVAFPVGTVLEFEQGGAGAVTIAAAGGVTVNSRGGATSTAGIYAVGSVKKVATDTWTLTGDIL